MAATIPESRLGRALRAGIPVALILLGAELLEGSWKVERNADSLALSWSPAKEGGARSLAFRLTSCAQGTCTNWTLPLALPAPHIGSNMVALAGILRVDCPEQRKSRIDAFLG